MRVWVRELLAINKIQYCEANLIPCIEREPSMKSIRAIFSCHEWACSYKRPAYFKNAEISNDMRENGGLVSQFMGLVCGRCLHFTAPFYFFDKMFFFGICLLLWDGSHVLIVVFFLCNTHVSCHYWGCFTALRETISNSLSSGFLSAFCRPESHSIFSFSFQIWLEVGRSTSFFLFLSRPTNGGWSML